MCEFALLQNVNVKFPFSQRQPDFSTTILTLLSPSQLTVMCNEYIAKYSVGSISNSLNKCTHSNSVIAGLYESNFNYVSAKSNLALNFYFFAVFLHSFPLILSFLFTVPHLIFLFILSQVITGSKDGEVVVWDYFTGSKVRSVKRCHEDTEMTFMSLDGTGHRLITGSREGEIKV